LSAPSSVSGFAIGTFPTSIAAGSNATFTVTMDAASTGSPGGTISFATNDTDENPFDIVISGTVTAPPVSEISIEESSNNVANGSSFSFGSTTQGIPVTKTFTIYNTGSALLTLTAPSAVTGFTIGTFPTSIAAASNATFTVTMDATNSGVSGGTISFLNNDADESSFDIIVSGTVGVASSIEKSSTASAIKVYPNRIIAGQTITIQSETIVNSVELMDQLGNKYTRTEYKGNETSIEFSFPVSITSGIYYLRINEIPYKLVVME
jgi:uncharacterized protein (UPF0548 family)